MSLRVDGRRCLVVGGGRTALRKARALLKGGALVRVVAADPCRGLKSLAGAGRLELKARPYRKNDAAGALLVVAAEGDPDANSLVASDAREAGALVNVVDSPSLCDFIFPALLERAPLQVAVSTSGECPAFAAAVRDELAGLIGPEYGIVARMLASVRRRMRRLEVPPRKRMAVMRELAGLGLAAVVRRKGRLAGRQVAERAVSSRLGGLWR